MLNLEAYISSLPEIKVRACGRLTRSVGMVLEATGPDLAVGSLAAVGRGGRKVICEVVGFNENRPLLCPIDDARTVEPGDAVSPICLTFRAGEWMLGRVLDGLGRPIDGRPPGDRGEEIELIPRPIGPLERGRISQPLDVGVRAINAILTVGVGQKIGLFSMPGVGKSSLLGMMARGAAADANVIALIGERGREVKEFIEDSLGKAGLRNSIVVVVTGDQAAPLRVKGAFLATAIADWMRRKGMKVLLFMDSLTRVAMAQRELGLASGEPPAARGYTPSVYALIPRLVEQAGVISGRGSVTGIYTVLLHEEDNDVIGEIAKGALDGHIVLDRALAAKGHFPAINPIESISRVAGRICSPEHNYLRERFIQVYSAWAEAEELMALGTYKEGMRPRYDDAVALHEAMGKFLRQEINETVSFDDSIAELKLALNQQ